MTTGKQWNTARKLRHIRGKLHTGSTTMVTITDENGQRRGITEKKEIERAIMDNNMAKFLQSSHIPFYQSPLQGRVCFKGLPSASQAVLAGVYDSNYDVNPAVLDVIAQWQLPSSVRNIGPQKLLLSVEQYKKLWRKAEHWVLPFCHVLLHNEGWILWWQDCCSWMHPYQATIREGLCPTALDALPWCYDTEKVRCYWPF